MKKILFTLALLWSVAYGQFCADEDTVRSNSATQITATTARINGTTSHFTGAVVSLQLKYVRVGQTDTVTSSGTGALRNLTGLQPATQYVYYYKSICGSGSQSQTIGPYRFTTLANTILYVDERPTRFYHWKADSSMIVAQGDTVVGREPSTFPQIRYKTSDNTFYGYYPNCSCWRALAIDSSGIIGLLDGKVDSVTVSGDSLFYWKVGVSYGYILPSLNSVWRNTGNSGIDTSVNWLGTNDNKDLVIKTNGNRIATFGTNGVTTLVGNLKLENTTNSSTGVIYKGSDRFIHDFKLSGTSGDNLFIGKQAGNFSMTGSTGIQGSYNVAVGVAAMSNNTTGLRCTAVGTYAMQNNTTGVNNTAVGQNALATNTTGYNNAVVGGRAAAFGSPHDVAAVGLDAASRTNNAAYIAAVGTDALYNAYNSMYAVAIGDSTLWKDSVGVKNTAVGSRAGYYLGDTYPNFSTQHDNYMTFLGADASRDSSISNQTGLTNSTAIGYNAKVYASNQVSIGNSNTTTTLLRGNVGIGTNSPTATVHATVTGVSGSVTSGYFESIGATTTNIAMRLKAATAVNNIALAVENGEGSVGIGTLTPAAVFHTVGTVRMASMGSASTDTTTYKPMGISSLGDVIPMDSWPQIRWKPRVGSTTSSATPTINTDNVDIFKLTAQAADITSFTTNLSGTPNDGDILEIQITGTATRAITWGSSFVSSTVTLPTTTSGTATLTVILQYYTTSSYGNNKWVCVNYY